MLSLNDEVNSLMKRKLSICNCDPCTCSDQKKEKYFRELLQILERFNKEFVRDKYKYNDSLNHNTRDRSVTTS